MSHEQDYLKLVHEQGAPRFDGFNPIAPRSHRWMMDADEGEETRLFGWVLWRTIDRDPDGRTGPPKKGRTSFAHDERAGNLRKGGHLEVKHAADDLGMSVANATDGFRRLVEQGKVRIDERGRIYPRGDAPEPRRIKGEDEPETESGEAQFFFYTENCPEAIRLSFQQLDKKVRAQYVLHYRAMYRGPDRRFAEHLESFDGERRARLTWEFLSDRVYAGQVLADAMLAARTVDDSLRQRTYQEAGFADPETRGRNRTERALTIQLNVQVGRDAFFSVQKNAPNSVQTPKSNLYKGENGSVQKTASLLGFQSSQSSQSEVERSHVENPAPEVEKVAPAARLHSSPTPPTAPLEPPAQEQVDAPPSANPNPILATVEYRFQRKLAKTDPLVPKFAELPERFGIPAYSVCRWMSEKLEGKDRQRYKIYSPGALYQFAERDLPGWIDSHRREIEADANWERKQRDFDPASYNGQIRALAAEKGMS